MFKFRCLFLYNLHSLFFRLFTQFIKLNFKLHLTHRMQSFKYINYKYFQNKLYLIFSSILNKFIKI